MCGCLAQVRVPRWAVGSVIGRGGETIKRLTADSGARLQFEQEVDGGEARICSINGTEQMVRIAESLIQRVIKEHEERNQTRRSSTTGDGGGGGGSSYGPPSGPVKRLPVEKNLCGLVIGTQRCYVVVWRLWVLVSRALQCT